jgi:hypothetical protein
VPIETVSVEEMKKERQALKSFLFGYKYGMGSDRPPPEIEKMERRFLELTELLRPKAKA